MTSGVCNDRHNPDLMPDSLSSLALRSVGHGGGGVCSAVLDPNPRGVGGGGGVRPHG